MNRKLKNLLVGGPGSTSVGDIGLLILRVGVGAMMALGHGKSKMFGEDRLGPPEQLIAGVQRMGFPAPTFFAWMAALTEFAGGLLLAVGILTRPAAAALTFNMLVAALVAHASDPLFSTGAGPAKEPALLYAIPFLSLIFLGAGRYSVDGLLNRSR
jgi:putative oxidoreductase